MFQSYFEHENGRESYKQYYLSTVKIKNYNVMTAARNFFDQKIRNNLQTYDNIRKIVTGQSDDYTTGCLLDYPYFKKCYKLTAIYLRKQQELQSVTKYLRLTLVFM